MSTEKAEKVIHKKREDGYRFSKAQKQDIEAEKQNIEANAWKSPWFHPQFNHLGIRPDQPEADRIPPSYLVPRSLPIAPLLADAPFHLGAPPGWSAPAPAPVLPSLPSEGLRGRLQEVKGVLQLEAIARTVSET
eukprot:gnl/Dysnectes_brevis/10242_a20011_214.p1 GENE.gnl/Dysnectes_brevis/10242_a20011_214~~gnl/Dysnectes_brevis/10242_a20011_214.p1  ORF type:complete len:134 (-),score=10.72 gnl/Dysnectes_brevis/10242_a20011_214:216-617(-)